MKIVDVALLAAPNNTVSLLKPAAPLPGVPPGAQLAAWVQSPEPPFQLKSVAVFPVTNSEQWLLSFEKMIALQPQIVVPGHGAPTDVATIKKYTYDYIVYLRSAVALILEQDGDLEAAYAIDQSIYKHLDTFDELAVKNAGRVFQQMEMDSF